MRIAIIAVLFFLSCNSATNSTRKESTVDSLNGMSEEEMRAKIKDSLDRSLTQNIYVGDTSNLSTSPVKIIESKPQKREYTNYKDISITYKNISGKTIDAIRFKWYGINSFGEPADMGADAGFGGGFMDHSLAPGKTTTSSWNILSKDLKKVVKAWAYEVVFSDGTKWTASK